MDGAWLIEWGERLAAWGRRRKVRAQARQCKKGRHCRACVRANFKTCCVCDVAIDAPFAEPEPPHVGEAR